MNTSLPKLYLCLHFAYIAIFSCMLFAWFGFLYAKFQGKLSQQHQHWVDIIKKVENEVSLSIVLVLMICDQVARKFDDVYYFSNNDQNMLKHITIHDLRVPQSVLCAKFPFVWKNPCFQDFDSIQRILNCIIPILFSWPYQFMIF